MYIHAIHYAFCLENNASKNIIPFTIFAGVLGIAIGGTVGLVLGCVLKGRPCRRNLDEDNNNANQNPAPQVGPRFPLVYNQIN